MSVSKQMLNGLLVISIKKITKEYLIRLKKITIKTMKTLTQILIWLSGKKSTIATVCMGVVAYLATKAIIGEAEVVLLTLVVGALFGSTSYATGKLVYKK